MSAQETSTVKLVLPGRPEFLHVARLTTGSVAARAGLTVDDIEDLKVAVGEACTNAVDHAFHDKDGPGDSQIVLSLTVGKDEITVEVEDEGTGFDPSELERGRRQAAEGAEGGLGFFLMKELTDSLRVESAPGSGTRVIMVKRATR